MSQSTEPRVLSLHTRFLAPFFFEFSTATETATAAQQSQVGSSETLWELQDAVPKLYLDNALPYVSATLLSSEGNGGRYLRVPSKLAESIFQNAKVDLGTCFVQPRLSCDAGIELFLTEDGVGLLSIALKTDELHSLSEARNFNNVLHRGQASVSRCSLLGKLPEWFSGDGNFTLPRLRDVLLQGLTADSTDAPRMVQDAFFVFTVVLLDETFDLNDAVIRKWAGSELIALQGHWDSIHAGAVSDALPRTQVILNSRHWAAVGHQGSAHLIGNQPKLPSGVEHPYNDLRLPWVFGKHFFTYIMALNQRLTMHRIRQEAVHCILAPNEDQQGGDRRLIDLTSRLLRFGVAGDFPQLQNSDAADQYYGLARDVLQVPQAWEQARETLSSIDSRTTAQGAAESQSHIAAIQGKVEWVEAFLISVYTVELAHVLSESVHKAHGPWLGIWLFSISALTLGAGLYSLQPWAHSKFSWQRAIWPASACAIVFALGIFLLPTQPTRGTEVTEPLHEATHVESSRDIGLLEVEAPADVPGKSSPPLN